MDHLAKLFGSIFGLSAFSVAIVAGVSVGNAASQVLFTALICMMVCYFVGTLLGMIADRTVSEHASGYAAARTIPEIPRGTNESNGALVTVDAASNAHAARQTG